MGRVQKPQQGITSVRRITITPRESGNHGIEIIVSLSVEIPGIFCVPDAWVYS